MTAIQLTSILVILGMSSANAETCLNMIQTLKTGHAQQIAAKAAVRTMTEQESSAFTLSFVQEQLPLWRESEIQEEWRQELAWQQQNQPPDFGIGAEPEEF